MDENSTTVRDKNRLSRIVELTFLNLTSGFVDEPSFDSWGILLKH